jgi:hypothetical protein
MAMTHGSEGGMAAGFEPLVDLTLDLDTEEINRSELVLASDGVIDDQTIELLRRANRIGLARALPTLVTSDTVPVGRSVVDVPLLFALHAHPECVYVWARIVVDLGSTHDAVIADMSPRDVQDIAVDVETTVGADLSFSVAASAVDIGAKPELTRKRTVFLPTVTASGTGFRKAYWDFYAKAGDYLHADKELHLLVSAPSGVPVTAMFTARAKVRLRGLARLIPLFGRSGGLDSRGPVQLA